MSEQTLHNNQLSETNINNFWLTCPPPSIFTPSHTRPPVHNLDHRINYIHPNITSYNDPVQINAMLPYSCNISNLNYQDQHIPYNQSSSNSFPLLPDNIDKEYIIKYLCPVQNYPKDETNIWIENWLSIKGTETTIQKIKPKNIEINEISNKIKECKMLLENMNNIKQLMENNLLIMTENKWKEASSNLFSIKAQLDVLIKSLNINNNSISELKLKLVKRKKKRDRLKRLKSNQKIIKLQQKDEIREINRKIDAWQNTLKENILKQKRANETKVEANIVLKGVKGKIEDARNQISLFDTLEKLRNCRLQNCVNKRKNPLLEESLNKLKIIWEQKLRDYNKEEDELKKMLSKSEAKKNQKREIEIHDKLAEWDQILFGADFRSHDICDNLQTFLDIRKEWDKYVVNENESSAASSIPVGWIIPSEPCNSDWLKYKNNVNAL